MSNLLENMGNKSAKIAAAILKIKKYAKSLDTSKYIDVDLSKKEFNEFKQVYNRQGKNIKEIICYDNEYNKHVIQNKSKKQLLLDIENFKKLRAFI